MIIILTVSAIALPMVLSATRDQAANSAARTLQGALVGARDVAINTGVPHGIRLVPDSAFAITRLLNGSIDPSRALAAGSIVLTEVPPAYTTGLAAIFPRIDYSAITLIPCLVIEESPGQWVQSGGTWTWQLHEQCNWWGNIRLGEQIEIDGQKLTVCGPVVDQNVESFTNIGPANTVSPIARVYTAPDGSTITTNPQYLMLMNGRDDNNDGFVDNGWDGIDQDQINGIDDLNEWEIETWPESLRRPIRDQPYTIARRPVPSASQQPLTLPGSIVIDLSTWATTRERSRLPVNPLTGNVDILISPDGTARPDLPYGATSSIGMDAAFFHFWICDRADVLDPTGTGNLTLPIPPDLKGSRALVSLQTRNGRLSTGPIETFDPTDAGAPFRDTQRGL